MLRPQNSFALRSLLVIMVYIDLPSTAFTYIKAQLRARLSIL